MAKILIIDDDIQATILLERVLGLSGYEAIGINDSSQALQTVRAIMPNLILLDLMMPEPNGFEICKMLRADQSFLKTPIVVTSALGDYETKEIAYAAGASDYMIKPLHIDTLIQTIEFQINKQ